MARGAAAGLLLTGILMLLALGAAVGSVALLGGDVAGFDNLGDAWFAMLRAALGEVCGCVCARARACVCACACVRGGGGRGGRARVES